MNQVYVDLVQEFNKVTGRNYIPETNFLIFWEGNNGKFLVGFCLGAPQEEIKNLVEAVEKAVKAKSIFRFSKQLKGFKR